MKISAHLQHPFTHRIPSLKLTSDEKKISLAAAALGILLGIIGAPLLFYAVSYYFKSRHLKQIRNSELNNAGKKTHDLATDQLIKAKDLCLQEDRFYIPTADHKKHFLDLNQIQDFFLHQFRTLTNDEQLKACDEFERFLEQCENLWKNQRSDTNEMIHRWKKEIPNLKKIALENESAQIAYLETKKQPAQKNFQSQKKASTMFNIVAQQEQPINHATPFSQLLGKEGEYKNSEAAVYKNIEYLIQDQDLGEALLIGVRGDGHCALRAFALGILYNAALKGGKAEIIKMLKKLNFPDDDIEFFLQGLPSKATNDQISKRILENFADKEKKLDFLLIEALRHRIVDHYQENYPTDPSIKERVESSALEKLRLQNPLAADQLSEKLSHQKEEELKQTKIKKLKAKLNVTVTQQKKERIEVKLQALQETEKPENLTLDAGSQKDLSQAIVDWFQAFRSPSDKEQSCSYVFANEKDLCTVCEILQGDLTFYSVSNALASRDKRDSNGERIILATQEVPATTSAGKPIMEKTKVGANTLKQATKTLVSYEKQKQPSYTMRHYKEGFESDQASKFAVCIFNRGGAHSDLILRD